MQKILNFVLGILLLAGSPPLHAEEFIRPTPLALVQTMFRFGALDINNDVVIDDYAKIAECDLYATFRADDFRWQKIRAGLRSKIRDEVVTYPTNYFIIGKAFLDPYDFKNKTFKLSTEYEYTDMFNSFVLKDNLDSACDTSMKMLPYAYYAVLETQIRLPGFVMDETDASALLARMQAVGNTTRKVVARFNLSVLYIDKVPINYGLMQHWYKGFHWVGKIKELRMYSRLESIEFFEDKEMTKRIYVYNPN